MLPLFPLHFALRRRSLATVQSKSANRKTATLSAPMLEKSTAKLPAELDEFPHLTPTVELHTIQCIVYYFRSNTFARPKVCRKVLLWITAMLLAGSGLFVR